MLNELGVAKEPELPESWKVFPWITDFDLDLKVQGKCNFFNDNIDLFIFLKLIIWNFWGFNSTSSFNWNKTTFRQLVVVFFGFSYQDVVNYQYITVEVHVMQKWPTAAILVALNKVSIVIACATLQNIAIYRITLLEMTKNWKIVPIIMKSFQRTWKTWLLSEKKITPQLKSTTPKTLIKIA